MALKIQVLDKKMKYKETCKIVIFSNSI